MADGEEDNVKEKYMLDILIGSDLSTRTLTSLIFNFRNLLYLDGYIVKFVNANMLLPWICKKFPVRTVFMIRHPCAVVSSQLRSGAWQHINKNNFTLAKGIFLQFPILEPIFDRISTSTELFAFQWVMETIVPLTFNHPGWFMTVYEKLMTDSGEIEKMFSYLNEKIPAKLYKRIRNPSVTAKMDSPIVDTNKQLMLWKEHLSECQVDEILSAVAFLQMQSTQSH